MTHSHPSKEKVNGERESKMLTPAKSTNGAVPPPPPPVARPRPNRPNNEQGGLSLVSILASFRRVWPVGIILGLLLGPALAAAGWYVLAPKHSATAFLQLAMDETPFVFKTADQASGGILAFKVYKNTQKQYVLSPNVLSKALASETAKDPKKRQVVNGDKSSVEPTDLMSLTDLDSLKELKVAERLQWLAEELKVTFPDDGEVMAIELSSKSAEDSAAIVNAVVEAYLQEVVENERSEKQKRYKLLEKTHEDTLVELKDRRRQIRDTADSMGTSDSEALTIAQQAAVQRFGLLEADLSKVNYELLEAKGKLEQAQQQFKIESEVAKQREAQNLSDEPLEEKELEVQITQLEIEQAIGKDLEYQQLASDARELSRRIREMERSAFGERFTAPLIADAQKLKLAMAERRTVVTGMIKSDLEMRKASGRLNASEQTLVSGSSIDPSQIRVLESNVKILEQRRLLIDREKEKCKQEMQTIGRTSAEVESLKDQVKSLEEVLSKLAAEKEATSIELKRQGNRVHKISDAAPMEGADLKKRLAATAGGGLFGLLLPLCGLVLFDMQKKHLDDPKKIKSELNIDILGMLPASGGPVGMLEPPSSKRGKQQYANVVESVHSIVAMLVKKASVDERQIFMVSSAGPSEGKSTLAQNLWTGLCEANYRCLLVDMDFRRPSIHRYLNVDIGLGVSDALSGKVDVETAIRSVDGQRYFMTAGESRQLNLAAMASDALPRFFDHLRGHYDFIIIDTAPILPVVDSRVIGEHVDGAVLSTIRDRSRLPQLIAAIELLKAHETDILGVVVSGFGSGTYGYSYYRS